MKVTNIEIASEAFCSETAVRKAIERGVLKPDSLGSVYDYVFRMRVKEMGWDAVDAHRELPAGVQKGCGGVVVVPMKEEDWGA